VTLTNYDYLIEEALKEEYITEKDLNSLREWKENPGDWKK
jgi:orotate phosphoribosyltransferase